MNVNLIQGAVYTAERLKHDMLQARDAAVQAVVEEREERHGGDGYRRKDNGEFVSWEQAFKNKTNGLIDRVARTAELASLQDIQELFMLSMADSPFTENCATEILKNVQIVYVDRRFIRDAELRFVRKQRRIHGFRIVSVEQPESPAAAAVSSPRPPRPTCTLQDCSLQ